MRKTTWEDPGNWVLFYILMTIGACFVGAAVYYLFILLITGDWQWPTLIR